MSRVWFITGASGGIGSELVAQLLSRGERVAATSRSGASFNALAKRYGDALWTTRLDIADPSAIRHTVGLAVERFGRLDVAVSAAGYGLLGAAEEVSDAELSAQFAVNLLGSIQLARAVLPQLRAQGGGRILQVSSTGGRVADPGMSMYNASKFGIEGFYTSIATELAPFGIEITLVEPGGTRTGFNGNLVLAQPIDAYEHGVLGQTRGMLSGPVDPEIMRAAVPGDPARTAAAIIDSVDVFPAPRRLVLGSGAYQAIGAELRGQLAELEAQRDLAYSVDADDVIAGRRTTG